MARSLRLDPEHGIHHVYSRGTRRWTLFIDTLDYQRFMQRLGVVCTRYGIDVYAYCLMGNHFHLVLYCPHGQLSSALRDLKSVYALMHNDRHGFSGPLFESRFGSKLVTSYDQLKTLIRYVHRNSLAIDPSRPLGSYSWSSHRFFTDRFASLPDWLNTTFPLSFFSGRADYQQFVESNLESDKVLFRPTTQPSSRMVPESLDRLALSAIMLAVASSAQCDVAGIRPRMRNGLMGLVVLIASDLANYTAEELTDACGFRSPQGVFNVRMSMRKRIERDDVLSAVHAEAVSRLLGAT